MAFERSNVSARELQAAGGLEESTVRSGSAAPPSHQILLITDRRQRGKQLAALMQAIDVRIVAPDEAHGALQASNVIIIDVDLHHPPHIKQLSVLLSAPRNSAAPILALLRRDSHLESVQAAALGAAKIVSAKTSLEETCRIVSGLVHPAISFPTSSPNPTPSDNLEQAGAGFSEVFQAAATGKVIKRATVDHATDCVKAAIADGGIRQWLERVWSYDDTTYQHCMMVTGLAAEFAARLGFSDSDQQTLVRGALLHDVGKAKIPLAILNKPGRFDDDELKVMRTHAQIGYDMLSEQGDYEAEVLEVVLRHHELLDGSGYPGGLSGGQIKDLVRLTTICDIYAALIEHRPYKQPMEPGQAFKILQDMGAKLESALVRAFMQVAENAATPLSVHADASHGVA